MTGLALMHGWGYGPETWQEWLGGLGGAPVVVLDAGYFGDRRMDLPEHPEGWVGLGHSLGFVRLLQMNANWRGLVGISPFLRFCRRPDKDSGTPGDVLDAMLARLDTDPADVLKRFQRRCGHSENPRGMPHAAGLGRLKQDLRFLRGLDASAPATVPPTLLLHARDDRIAPVALAEEACAQLPGSRLKLLDSGGHALPQTRAQDCLRLVKDFLRGLG